jgi:hypothetical protein
VAAPWLPWSHSDPQARRWIFSGPEGPHDVQMARRIAGYRLELQEPVVARVAGCRRHAGAPHSNADCAALVTREAVWLQRKHHIDLAVQCTEALTQIGNAWRTGRASRLDDTPCRHIHLSARAKRQTRWVAGALPVPEGSRIPPMEYDSNRR